MFERSAHMRLGRVFFFRIAVKMPREIALAVVAHAIAQNQIVHASADIDRVDLHVPEMRESSVDAGKRGIEALGAANKLACGEPSDFQSGGIKRKDAKKQSSEKKPSSDRLQASRLCVFALSPEKKAASPGEGTRLFGMFGFARDGSAGAGVYQAAARRPLARAGSNQSEGADSGANSGHSSASSVRRFSRARAMRLFTVPTLMPRACAISS